MSDVYVDYETRSGLALPQVGKQRYLHDAVADIVCVAYKINGSTTRLWTPGLPIPRVFTEAKKHTWYAFNISFDAAVTQILGAKYGIQDWPIENQVDVMALCGRFTLPQSLSKAAQALNLKRSKDSKGLSLIKKVCVPPFKYTLVELKNLYRYCIRDVDVLYDIVQALPATVLSTTETQYWQDTCAINYRGLPIDLPAVTRIQTVIEYYLTKAARKLPLITDGAVTTPGQRKRIMDWAQTFDVELPNLQAKTVDLFLDKDLPDPVRQVLQIRKLAGGAAIKKYSRLQDMVFNGRLHDVIKYYGAGHTGRDSGVGFQMQNLPRASVEDPEAEIQKFYDTTILKDPNPMGTAKALIRSMIRAKPGNILLAADYKSIEYVMLMWFCGEEEKLQDFRKGICPYKVFGSQLMGVKYEDITKEQRQQSKPGILGGGYCLSAKSLIPYAADMGISIPSISEAARIIQLYRSAHPRVKASWQLLLNASIDAVSDELIKYPVNSVVFQAVRDRTARLWLSITLPSGRPLFYCEPRIELVRGQKIVTFKGVNSKTKQWTTHQLRAPMLINNIIQGIARDVMLEGSRALIHKGYHLVGRVHDELIAEEKIGSSYTLERMIALMCAGHDWCKTAPIMADGFASERYKK